MVVWPTGRPRKFGACVRHPIDCRFSRWTSEFCRRLRNSLCMSPNHGPAGITRGPDGNLWFTEVDAMNGNQIGRITPTGQITEFSTGITPGSQPFDITAGPDGNLWFTETADRIGRITPTGQVTEFTAGITANSQPSGIVAGPDGNLWFTEPLGPNSLGAIARITPTGVVTEFRTGLTPRQRAVPNDRRPRSQSLVHGTARRRGTNHDSRRRHRIPGAGLRRTSSPTGSRPGQTAICGSPNSAAGLGGLRRPAR